MDDDQCSLPIPPLHSGGTYNVAMRRRTIYDCLQYKKKQLWCPFKNRWYLHNIRSKKKSPFIKHSWLYCVNLSFQMTKVIVTCNNSNHQSQNILFQWFVFILLFNVINHGLKPPPHLLTIYTIVKTLIVHEMLIFPEHLMRIPRTHGLNAGTPDLTLRVLSLTPGTLGLTQF